MPEKYCPARYGEAYGQANHENGREENLPPTIFGVKPQIGFANNKEQGKRLANEWPMIVSPLRGALWTMAEWKARMYGRSRLVITCLWRSRKENAEQDGANPKSLHMANRAADIRIWEFKKRQNQLDEWVKFWINKIRLYDTRLQIDYYRGKSHIHVEFDERG